LPSLEAFHRTVSSLVQLARANKHQRSLQKRLHRHRKNQAPLPSLEHTRKPKKRSRRLPKNSNAREYRRRRTKGRNKKTLTQPGKSTQKRETSQQNPVTHSAIPIAKQIYTKEPRHTTQNTPTNGNNTHHVATQLYPSNQKLCQRVSYLLGARPIRWAYFQAGLYEFINLPYAGRFIGKFFSLKPRHCLPVSQDV